MAENIQAIQEALKAKGFDPGPIDGEWGRKTMAAVRAFQAKNGLTADGIVGPRTSKALFAGAAAAPAQLPVPWMSEALKLKGVHEDVSKTRDNPVIMDWASNLGIAYGGDDVAWCGLFTAHCVGSSLPEEALPSNPLGARNWLKFGEPTEPRYGAILVFWRGSKDGWQGHVGFYAGEDAVSYRVLGGNQSDQVCETKIRKDRLLAARWPRSADFIATGAIRVAGDTSAFSMNEA